MDVVFAYADRMIVLARGQLIAEGKPDAIRDHPKVQEVYFGTGKTFEKRNRRRTQPGQETLGASRRLEAQRTPLLDAHGLAPGTARRRSCSTSTCRSSAARSSR